MKTRATATGTALLGLLLLGCTVGQAARPKQVGFLAGEYSLLKRGEDDESRLHYLNPDVAWSDYYKLLIDPVSIWRWKNSDIAVSQADVQRIANNFYRLLYSELSRDYEIVSAPGPGTIRFRAAITELESVDLALNVLSSVEPHLDLALILEDYGSDRPLFTGEIGIAYRATDAESGELIAAGVGRRVGPRQLVEAWKIWQDVDDGLHYWAQLFRFEFCEQRIGQGCFEPRPRATF